MKIGICLRKSAYLPEAYAYKDFLISNGFDVELGFEQDLSNNVDLKLKFLGYSLKPYSRLFNIPEIHEYGSLSTPPLAKFKDLIKSRFNSKPLGRIFLNNVVKDNLTFKDNRPFIFRDMGIDSSFFIKDNTNKVYDIVYSGAERNGLIHVIKKLYDCGFSILVIGDFSKPFIEKFINCKTITFTGRVERRYLPSLYQSCRFGLNFIPDQYPFNIQTSTKTLEYCASGLGVISNRYYWIENFKFSRSANFFWLTNHFSKNDVEDFNFQIPSVIDLAWNNVLTNSDFISFLNSSYYYKAI